MSLGLLLLVALGVGLVVARGLAGIAEHQRLNHRLLAERVVDELERELSALVAREEERSFADYRYFVIPPGLAPGSVALGCSPLVAEPRPPWVLGYYQREPDGSLRSPAVPTNDELALEVFGYRAGAGDRAFLERAGAWFAEDAALAAPIELPVQQVETLVALGEGDDDWPSLGKSSLNRGFGSRGERDSRSLKAEAQSVYNYQVPEADNLVQQQVLAVQEAQHEADATPRLRRIEADLRAALPGAGSAEIDVRVDPLDGRAVADVLLLERRVHLAGEVYRQGLALDPVAMLDALGAEVLGGSELAPHVALHWLVPGADEPPHPTAAYSFAYRFAPPFDDLGLRADLARVPGERPPGTAWLLGLGGGILAVVALALLALQRAVAARVGYAERRADFVAAVTHELKTPLTAIRMYGEMLGSDMGDEAAARRRYAGTITAEGERLSRLIDNVLELGRLERDDRDLALTVGDPRELLQQALTICAPHAERQGFDLELACAPGLPPVRCDRDALLQVVVNLVDNAVKFAREAAERRVVLAAEPVPDGLVLRVRDFGPGIPEAQLGRVCEPFFRGERELTRRTGGTGIGLALVRGLVERMGGHLSLANHPEGGLVAEIRLATG